MPRLLLQEPIGFEEGHTERNCLNFLQYHFRNVLQWINFLKVINFHLVREPSAVYIPPTREHSMGIVELDIDYRPGENEPFMNEKQQAYFRSKLEGWKTDILRESKSTIAILQDESDKLPDQADRASSETDRSIELRARDRQRKLITKIDAALKRIEDGTYGYCEETGEPIGLKRLDARPIATLSIEAQERHERREKVFRDD